MFKSRLLVSLMAASAMTLAIATPAHAGKADRARQAIAAAEAKIQAAQTTGAATDMPRRVAAAQAELARAKEDLSAGRKDEAIETAIHSGALADAALGEAQKHKDDALASEQQAKVEAVVSAQQQTSQAQVDAAQANARADNAQQSAANSAAQAADARALAAAALQQQAQPPQVETTVTTQQVAVPAHKATHRTVVRKRVTHRKVRHAVTPAPVSMTRTTTTVTTH